MDLNIPYSFYPLALPGWIAWVLFLLAVFGGISVGFRAARNRGWKMGLGLGVLATAGFLIATMMLSTIIAFFVHDF